MLGAGTSVGISGQEPKREALVSDVLPLPRHRCTGCGACYSGCPEKAIVMEVGGDGFSFPQVDKELCIQCGSCQKKCPALSPDSGNISVPECYAVWADEATRKKSSSGGLFTLLADHVLEQGGYICGAAFDEEWRVKHVIIETREELDLLRGSKYVQSDKGNVFQRVKELLKKKKRVLFTGCPCEVAGLQKFLAQKYDNLITADILCHCTASPGVWSSYLEESYSTNQLESIRFRDKSGGGWKCTETTIILQNGEKIKTDTYVKGFHRGLYARESCENCQFSNFPRQGDFTMGDWWGIEAYKPGLNDNGGTSLFLVNNSEKMDIFAVVRNRAQIFEQVPLEYIKGNGHINNPLKLPPARRHLLRMVNSGVRLTKALEAILDHRYDVGVAGFWYGLNYGSVLTSFAMSRVLENLGYTAIHLNKPEGMWTPKYYNKNSFPVKFTRRNSLVNDRRHSFDALNEQCRMFLVGSDTVWNSELLHGNLPFFFLDFAAAEKKKITYASSFGRSVFEVKDSRLREYVNYLVKRLDAVSVREERGLSLLKSEFKREAERVLDPVFLLDPDEYREVVKEGADIEKNREYIFTYFLSMQPKKKKKYETIISKLRLPVLYFANPNEEHMAIHGAARESVENWLAGIDGATLVVADSFHAACFSIILQKNFIILRARESESNSRFETLFKILQLEDRLVYVDDITVDLNSLALKPIDYGRVESLLQQEKQHSLNWLQKELASPPLANKEIRDELENISGYFRDEVGNVSAQLQKARKRLGPLNSLIMAKDNNGLTPRDHLSASSLFKLGMRLEYWRCRLMQKWGGRERRGKYFGRAKALEHALYILVQSKEPESMDMQNEKRGKG